jgi:hypothetical protein
MTTYEDILKSADPSCCYRKKKASYVSIATENLIVSLGCVFTTFIFVKMQFYTLAQVFCLLSFYMSASTITYISLMLIYKPPNHLNNEPEQRDHSDFESEDDYLPPLYTISEKPDRVLEQLQRVVDETNARNEVRMTRSMCAKTATTIFSEPPSKKIS